MDEKEGIAEMRTQYFAVLSSHLNEFLIPEFAFSPVGLSQVPTQC